MLQIDLYLREEHVAKRNVAAYIESECRQLRLN